MQILSGFVVGYLLCSLMIVLTGGIELFKLSKTETISKNVNLRFSLFAIFWLPMILYWIWRDWIRKPK